MDHSYDHDWTALPPALEVCGYSLCEDDTKSVDTAPQRTMMRCSSCQNAFYCSAKCQKSAWRADHKENCSTLPQPLPPPQFGEIDPDVLEQFSRVWELMVRIKESWKQAGLPSSGYGTPTGSEETISIHYYTDATKELQKMTFPPAFTYSHPSSPPSIEEPEFKSSKNYINIIRLTLIYQMSLFSSQMQLNRLYEMLGSLHFASDWPQYWGPKIAARPGDLSYGEYLMLPQLMVIFFVMEGEEFPGPHWEKVKKVWEVIQLIMKRLGGVARSAGPEK